MSTCGTINGHIICPTCGSVMAGEEGAEVCPLADPDRAQLAQGRCPCTMAEMTAPEPEPFEQGDYWEDYDPDLPY